MCAENQKTLKFYTEKGKGKAGLHCDARAPLWLGTPGQEQGGGGCDLKGL